MCVLDEAARSCDAMLSSLLLFDVVVIGLVTSVNCTVITAILRRRHTLLSLPAPRFVFNMCVADLAVAATSCYYKSFIYLCPVRSYLSLSKSACLARFSLMVMSFLASSLSLMLLAIDRYCAVLHALRYTQILNTWRSCVIVVSIWLIAAVVAAVLLLWNNWTSQKPCEEQFVVPLSYIGSLAAISHCVVFGVIATTHLKIHQLASRKYQEGRGSLRSPSAQVLILLTTCYIACWTPFLVVLVVRQFLCDIDEFVEHLYQVTFSFASLNYVFNSFIFSWKNKLVRAAVLDLFKSHRFQALATTSTKPIPSTDTIT